MQIWLKLIGSGTVPITGYPWYGNYKEPYIGFRKRSKPSIRMGDKLFLYAPGGSMRIFALVKATSEPEYDNNYDPEAEGSCYWKLHIEYEINLPVNSGIHIDEISTSRRKLSKSVQQQSHIKLLPEECELAFTELGKKSKG
jgi:hypothetical protein